MLEYVVEISDMLMLRTASDVPDMLYFVAKTLMLLCFGIGLVAFVRLSWNLGVSSATGAASISSTSPIGALGAGSGRVADYDQDYEHPNQHSRDHVRLRPEAHRAYDTGNGALDAGEVQPVQQLIECVISATDSEKTNI
jgi:hypothetical protein